jgi:threonine synthase
MEETQRFLACCYLGDQYDPEAEQLDQLRSGMFAAVISDSRVENVIHSVYRTSNYIFSPYSALAYASLLDYRAKTGESRNVLLLAERSPTCDVERVAEFLRVDTSEVFRRMSGK